jgi:putative tricarboxylic transport membrane protein
MMKHNNRRSRWGELLMSIGVLALGAATLMHIRQLGGPRGYEQLGPRLFPYFIGGALVLFGLLLAYQVFTGGWRNLPPEKTRLDKPDWPAFAVITSALVLHMAIIGSVGFVLASTLLYLLTARAFGSRAWLRNAVIGLLLSTGAFYLFTVGLGLHLTTSPLRVI